MKEILRPNDLTAYLSVSRSTLTRLQKHDDFPKRLNLSIRSIGYKKSEIDAWLASRCGELK